MKIILYMAATPNGYIARNDKSTPWSNEDWQSFTTMVNKLGNLVIGRKTYEIMKKFRTFSLFQNNPTIIVVSSKKRKSTSCTFVKSPKEAISMLKKKGFGKVLVAGGGKLNSSFMKQKLIDEIYLDIEPIIFGRGIQLFKEDIFEAKLKLIGTKKLNFNTIQLHYKIIKK